MNSIRITINTRNRNHLIIKLLALLLTLILVDSKQEVLTNQFVIEAEGGINSVKQLALKHGFIFLGHIFGSHYHFLLHHKIAKRSTQFADKAHKISLENERNVR